LLYDSNVYGFQLFRFSNKAGRSASPKFFALLLVKIIRYIIKTRYTFTFTCNQKDKNWGNREMIDMSLFKKLLENLGWFNPEPEIAVLIDAENISPKVAEFAIAQARQIGFVRIIRAFGDWTAINPPGYIALATSVGLHRVQVDKLRAKKNSIDIALASDAAMLAGRGTVDTIVLVSGDQDYVPLVQALKGAGCMVIGIAGNQAALDLRPACHCFIVAETPTPARRTLAKPAAISA
jgi:hypothetical protein